jgi:hypothetical protein
MSNAQFGALEGSAPARPGNHRDAPSCLEWTPTRWVLTPALHIPGESLSQVCPHCDRALHLDWGSEDTAYVGDASSDKVPADGVLGDRDSALGDCVLVGIEPLGDELENSELADGASLGWMAAGDKPACGVSYRSALAGGVPVGNVPSGDVPLRLP